MVWLHLTATTAYCVATLMQESVKCFPVCMHSMSRSCTCHSLTDCMCYVLCAQPFISAVSLSSLTLHGEGCLSWRACVWFSLSPPEAMHFCGQTLVGCLLQATHTSRQGCLIEGVSMLSLSCRGQKKRYGHVRNGNSHLGLLLTSCCWMLYSLKANFRPIICWCMITTQWLTEELKLLSCFMSVVCMCAFRSVLQKFFPATHCTPFV